MFRQWPCKHNDSQFTLAIGSEGRVRLGELQVVNVDAAKHMGVSCHVDDTAWGAGL